MIGYKKFAFLAPFVFIFTLLYLFISSPSVSALTVADINRASYKATSLDTIQMTIARPPNDGGSDIYTFTDSNPGDSNPNYKYGGPRLGDNEMCPSTSITLSGPLPRGLQTDTTVLAKIAGFIADGPNIFSDCDTLSLAFGQSIRVLIPAVVSQGGQVSNPNGPQDTEGEDQCVKQSFTSFEWILCPLLEGLDAMAGALNKEVEQLLFFDTTVGQADKGEKSIKTAWSLFRYIATVVLVIIMLVMVISQAISWGPFDAYTIRKILPKIIAGTIAIQLSWPICLFLINFFNDLGQGVAGLMTLPFGGLDKLTLDDIVAISLDGVGGGTRGLIFLGIVGGVILAGFGIFMLIGLAIGVVASLLIAFIVLVVRKVVLIMLLILAPIAFVMWILPGTKRYWDIWQNTFIGLLLMFPIIMALIASGRIVAWIIAQGGTFGNTSFGGALVEFIVIIVAFFAPFWLIPKTFQWGGRTFASIGGAMNNRSKGVFDRPKNFFQGRQKLLGDTRRATSAERYAGRKPYARGPLGWMQKGGGLYHSGKADPTLLAAGGKRAVNRKRATFLAEVPKAQSEALEAEKLSLGLATQGMDRDRVLAYSRRQIDAGGSEESIRAAIEVMIQQRDATGIDYARKRLVEQGQGNLWNTIQGSNFSDLRTIDAGLAADIDLNNAQSRTIPDSWQAMPTTAPGMNEALGRYQRLDDEVLAKMGAPGWYNYINMSRAAGSPGADEALERIDRNENLQIAAEVREFAAGRANLTAPNIVQPVGDRLEDPNSVARGPGANMQYRSVDSGRAPIVP